MMTITLIRHGATQGNLERRFIGNTDEPLLDEERSRLSGLSRWDVKLVYISPMKRAYETARILFPKAELVMIDGLKECDFGEYEYKNHEELNGLLPYQRFIDSGGYEAFPGGEGRADFTARVLGAFEDIVSRSDVNGDEIYIVSHGGTIMAIMEGLVTPHRDFYDWMCGNGEGYVIRCEVKDHYTVSGVYP